MSRIVFYFSLDGHQSGQYLLRILLKTIIAEPMGEVRERPPPVHGAHVEEFAGPWREAHDAKLPVQKYGSDVGSGQQVLKIARQLTEFFHLMAVFLVQGAQFFIHRLSSSLLVSSSSIVERSSSLVDCISSLEAFISSWPVSYSSMTVWSRCRVKLSS